MKRIPLYISSILLTAALTGCSQQDSWDEQNNQTNNKESVAFRAGIFTQNAEIKTRGTGGNKIAFTQTNTGMKLYASAQWKNHNDTIKIVDATLSEKKKHNENGDLDYNDVTAALYWDDFGAGDLNNCETTGNLTTTPVATNGMTIYGIAVDGAALPTRFSSISYDNLKTVSDELSTDQSKGINTEDVLISNNISGNTGADGKYKYVRRSTTSRELVFKHIYNKITLNFVHGEGFKEAAGNEVKLPEATSVTLPNYNITGTLDITTGTFSSLTTNTVAKLHKLGTATENFDYTYEALTLPGRTFSEKGTTEAITFNFGGNTYSVTEGMIQEALSKNGETGYSTMTSGVHYIFNITVNKSAVKLSATIADWTIVNGDLAPSNGQIVNFAGLTTNFATDFNLYMAETTSDKAAYDNESSKSSYLSPVEFTWIKENGTTPAHYDYKDQNQTIYWPNNATYYHFRALANGTKVEDKTKGDSVALTTKQTTSNDNKYADVIWGAPYTNGTPSTISPALGPTSNEIKLEFFHKMAEVSFILKTTEGSDKVDLTSAPSVILNCVETGKVLMQDGSVSAGTGKKDFNLTATTETTTKFENIGVVPQTTKNITLKITTADGNVYQINDLSTIKVTGETNLILNWVEGTKYVYTITLKKSGVAITAQIKDWNNVTAADETVVIQ